MSVPIDQEEDQDSGDSRQLLSSWLDNYIAGRCDRAQMHSSFLEVCRANPEAQWDALALLDQYQRRGRVDIALARSLKADIAQLVFGVANQASAAAPRPPEDPTETTGSRWRKAAAQREREPPSPTRDPVAEPTLLRREFDPATRPPQVERAERVERSNAANNSPGPFAPVMTAATFTLGSVLRERYELVDLLRPGRVGTVYKALDRHRAHLPQPARYVAIKVLKFNDSDRSDSVSDLEREAYHAQSLSHPNIVRVFDFDRHGGAYFLVMELLEGELLSAMLQRYNGAPVPREQAFNIIGSLGAALQYAHRRGVAHGDVKPANIMMTNIGDLKLLDFGFARRQPFDPWVGEATSDERTIASTPAYASAERVNGEEPQSSDDLYSLACIAYELLSGQHPFGGRSAPLARAHGREAQRPAGLKDSQWMALQTALRWGRGERRIEVNALVTALGCHPATTDTSTPRERIRERVEIGAPSNWPMLAGVAALLVVAVGVTLWVATANGPEAAPKVQSAARRTPAELVPAPEPIAAVQELTPAASNSSPAPVESPPSASSKAPASAAQTASFTSNPSPVTAPPSASVSKGAPSSTSTLHPGAGTAGAANDSGGAGPGTLQFEKDTYATTESDGVVKLTVRRTGDVNREARFQWRLQSNSAEAGQDFAAIGPMIDRIPAGSRTAVVSIPLVRDSISENTELFLVELQQVDGGPAIGEQSTAAVIIVDDD
jgi:serine/threonine protein kinase